MYCTILINATPLVTLPAASSALPQSFALQVPPTMLEVLVTVCSDDGESDLCRHSMWEYLEGYMPQHRPTQSTTPPTWWEVAVEHDRFANMALDKRKKQ